MLVRFGILAVVVVVSIQGHHHHHHHHGGGFHLPGSFSFSSTSAGGGPFLEHGLHGGGSGSFSGSGSFGGDLGRRGSIGPDFEYNGGIDQLLHKFRQGIKGGGSFSGKFETHGGGGYGVPFGGSFSGAGSHAGGFSGQFGPGQSAGEKEVLIGTKGHKVFIGEHGSGSSFGLHSGISSEDQGAAIIRGGHHPGSGSAPGLGLETHSSGGHELNLNEGVLNTDGGSASNIGDNSGSVPESQNASAVGSSGHNLKLELRGPELGSSVLSGSINSSPGASLIIHTDSVNNGPAGIGLGIRPTGEPLGVVTDGLGVTGDRGPTSRPTISIKPESSFEGNNAGPVVDREGNRLTGQKYESPWTLDLGGGAVIHGGGSGYQYDGSQSGGNLATNTYNENNPEHNGQVAGGSIHAENIAGSLSGGNINAGKQPSENIAGPLAGFGIFSHNENNEGHGGLGGSIGSTLDGSLVGGNILASKIPSGNILAPLEGFGIKQEYGQLGGSIGSTLDGNFGGSLLGENIHAGNIPSGNLAGSLSGGNIHAGNIPFGNIAGSLPGFGQGHSGLGGGIGASLDKNFGGSLVGGHIHGGKIPSGIISGPLSSSNIQTGNIPLEGSLAGFGIKQEHGSIGSPLGGSFGGSLVGGNIHAGKLPSGNIAGTLSGGNIHAGNIPSGNIAGSLPGFGIEHAHSGLGGSIGASFDRNFGGSLGGNIHGGKIPSGIIAGPLSGSNIHTGNIPLEGSLTGFGIKQQHGSVGSPLGGSFGGSLVGGNIHAGKIPSGNIAGTLLGGNNHAGNIPSGNIGGSLGFGVGQGNGGLDGSIGSTLHGNFGGSEGNINGGNEILTGTGNIPLGNIEGSLAGFGIKQQHGSIGSPLGGSFGGSLVGGNIHAGKIPSGNIAGTLLGGNNHAGNIPSGNIGGSLGFGVGQGNGGLDGSIGSTLHGNFGGSEGNINGGNGILTGTGNIPLGNIEGSQAVVGIKRENGSIGTTLGNFGGTLGGSSIHAEKIPSRNIDGPLTGFSIASSNNENQQGHDLLGGSIGSALQANFGVSGGNIGGNSVPESNFESAFVANHENNYELKPSNNENGKDFSVNGGFNNHGTNTNGVPVVSNLNGNSNEPLINLGVQETKFEQIRPESAIHSENFQINSGSIVHKDVNKEQNNIGPGGSLSILATNTAPVTETIIHGAVSNQHAHNHRRPDSGLEGTPVGSFRPSGLFIHGNGYLGQPNFGPTNAFGYNGNFNSPNLFAQNEFGLIDGGIPSSGFGIHPSTTARPSLPNSFGSFPTLTPTSPGLISVDGTIFKPVGGIIIRHKNGKEKEGSSVVNIPISGNAGSLTLTGVHKEQPNGQESSGHVHEHVAEVGSSLNGKIEGQGPNVNIGNGKGKHETFTTESTLTGSTGGPILNFGIYGDRRPVQSNLLIGSSFDGGYRLPTVNFGIHNSGFPEYNGPLTGYPSEGYLGTPINYFGIHSGIRPVYDGSGGSLTEVTVNRPEQYGQASSDLSVGATIKGNSGASLVNSEIRNNGIFNKKQENSGPGTNGIVIGSTGEPVLNSGINAVSIHQQNFQNEKPGSKTSGIVVGSLVNGNVGKPGTELNIVSGSVLGDAHGNSGLVIASPNEGNTAGPIGTSFNYDQLSGPGSFNIEGPHNFATNFGGEITGTSEKPFFNQESIYPSVSSNLANVDGTGFYNGIISSSETPNFSGNLNFNVKGSLVKGTGVNNNLETSATLTATDAVGPGSKQPESNSNIKEQQTDKNNKDIKNACGGQNINIRLGEISSCGIGNGGPSANGGNLEISAIKKGNLNSGFQAGLGVHGGFDAGFDGTKFGLSGVLPEKIDAGFDGTKLTGGFGNQGIGSSFVNGVNGAELFDGQGAFDRDFTNSGGYLGQGSFTPGQGGFGFDAGFDGSKAGFGGGFGTHGLGHGLVSSGGLDGFGNGGFRHFGGNVKFDVNGNLRQEPINQDKLAGGPVGFYRHEIHDLKLHRPGTSTTERNSELFGRIENQKNLPGGPIALDVETERNGGLGKIEGGGTLNLRDFSNLGGGAGSFSGIGNIAVNEKVPGLVDGGLQSEISGSPIGIDSHLELEGGLGGGSTLQGDNSFEASKKSSSSSGISSEDSVKIAKDLLRLLANGAADTTITKSSSASSSESSSASSSSSTSSHSTYVKRETAHRR